ncbi:hypothetical protein [Inmirania thermothiophila]|nr:hypothetical protein [Inmirania thermothiophila]
MGGPRRCRLHRARGATAQRTATLPCAAWGGLLVGPVMLFFLTTGAFLLKLGALAVVGVIAAYALVPALLIFAMFDRRCR